MSLNEKYKSSGTHSNESLVQKAATPATATELAIMNLNDAVANAHMLIARLIDLAEPHMPRFLFEPADGDCEMKGSESRVPHHLDSNSRLVNHINQATNEIDRLSGRIEYLKGHLVV